MNYIYELYGNKKPLKVLNDDNDDYIESTIEKSHEYDTTDDNKLFTSNELNQAIKQF